MPESLDLEYLCAQCVNIAHDAGSRIMEIYNKDFDIRIKDDNSPLTDADMAANEVIIKGLSGLTPDIPILSEESEKIPYAVRRHWQTFWLVDPLDGTREFIRRNGEFTVNIALIHNHESIIGIVHVPVSGIDYYAWQGGGACKAERGAAPRSIQVKKPGKDRLIVVGSRSHVTPGMQAYMQNLGEVEILGMGSSIKFCLVAEGSADLYPRLGPTSEWDTAAAQCVVEQAGGHVVKTDMTRLEYNTGESLCNPYFFVFGDNDTDWSAFL